MPVTHTIVEGEGISSIAERYGLAPDTIWFYAPNRRLHQSRRDPNVLAPGDMLQIPDLREKKVACATGRHHRFRRRGVPAQLEIQLLKDGLPRSATLYVLILNGVEKRNSTDDHGILREWVPCGVQEGLLRIADGDLTEEYRLQFGQLDPVSSDTDVRGIQQRLNNLGISCPMDGLPGPETAEAIALFQVWAGLPQTGDCDAATLRELQKLHDSPELPPEPSSSS